MCPTPRLRLLRRSPKTPLLLSVAMLALVGSLGAAPAATQTPSLEAGFAAPPPAARLRAFWWWLNGNVTKASITRDLVGMREKGFGGAVLFDAGGAKQAYMGSNDQVPAGPVFLGVAHSRTSGYSNVYLIIGTP